MNWTLEVVVVPVSDVDRAKAFYADQLGFYVDHNTKISEGNRGVCLPHDATNRGRLGASLNVRRVRVGKAS